LLKLETLYSELEKYSELSTEQADIELSKLRSRAEKRISETNKRLDIILETVVRFKEDVEETDINAMDKYSNRIYEEVNLTINSIEKPSKITLRTLEKYSQETRSSFLKQDEVLIKYVRLLKGPKYAKRVKSLSKALQKLNSDLTKLERFITSEYSPSAGIENISLIIEDVFHNLEVLNETYALVNEKKDQVKVKDTEIEEIKTQLEKIQNHPSKVKFHEAKENYNTLKKQVDAKFQNIRKAIRKYENNISKMKQKPDTSLLKEFLKDITDTLATQSSIGGISSLLEKVLVELEKSALKLKKDRREATKADITELLEGNLNKISQEAKEGYNNRENLAQELRDLELDSEETKVSTHLEATKRDRNRIIEREIRDFEKIKDNSLKALDEITEKIQNSIDPNVSLKSELVSLPEWALLLE
jgi:ElaB/YqjD/DUF883 family membrane-anchored ribosome-binding protein